MFPEEEVRELSHKYSKKLAPSQIREILNYWMDRRPMNLPPEMLREVFVEPEFLFKKAEDIINYLRERDWRGAIVSVVGEYGSGKTQLGLILKRMLRGERDVRSYFKTLDSFRDVRTILLEDVTLDDVEPLVLIVDEVDQLLSELYRGRRERIEEMADIVRFITEGSASPPLGSVVLLMSTRAKGELASDRSLANRLIARAREFRLTLTDEEREKAALEAVKKVMSLYMALESAFDVYKYFDLLYEFLTSRARTLALTLEIGGIVKEVTLTLKEILDRIDKGAKVPEGTELGRTLEEALKKYLKERASAVPFEVRVGERVKHYLAKFSEERVRVEQAISDGQYVVHTYDPSRGFVGSPVLRVLVEVKTGTSWLSDSNAKRQIQSFLNEAPLLLFWLSDHQNEIPPFEGPLRVIVQDPSPFKVSMILKGGRELLDSWVDLKRDVEENVALLTLPRTASNDKGKEGVADLDVVASTIVSAVLIELKKARSYKKVSTLHAVILNAMRYAYEQMGLTPPQPSSTLIESLLRVFVREGLGRFSKTGKTVQITKESRLRIMELESNPGRRKRVEEELRELLKKVMG